jgi:amidase
MVAGPLHGIVFCVKDDTEMEGFDCTIGCTRRIYNPCKETAVIVQSLEQLGAIPFCR